MLLAVVLIAVSATTAAQTFTPLYDFGTNSGDPTIPHGHFAQARDGNLYNTSQYGGLNGFGAVYQLTSAGKMRVVWNFTSGTDGSYPVGGLTLGTDGNLYGTAAHGGDVNNGTAFKLTTTGKLTVLNDFNIEGQDANFAPVQGTDGNFYGTLSDGVNSYGTIYKMTPSGAITNIYEFEASPDDNYRYPQGLIQGTDGNFYGTTPGAHSDLGMVFKMTPQGKLSSIHEFLGSPNDGQSPSAYLIQASDGNFYGTTLAGGINDEGTVYRMTPAGNVTILHSFNEDEFGYYPASGVVQGTDGNFYGAASSGGQFGAGLLYQITSTGTYTVLYDNFQFSVGSNPQDPLFQQTDGTFFGDTVNGPGGAFCSEDCGTLFSLSMGLGPFISFVPGQSSGKVGAAVGILGQGFSAASAVSFNGVAASFKIVADTYLTATVPSGATTGLVKVKTAGSALTSNRKFQVVP